MKGGEAIYRPREAGILQTKTEFTSGERESTPTLTLIITEERVRSLTNSNRSLFGVKTFTKLQSMKSTPPRGSMTPFAQPNR